MSKKNFLPLLVVLYGTAFVAAFNENIVNVALVDIMAQFSISSATAQWLVTGYMIVTAIVVTLMAFLLKRFSLRTLFFIGSSVLVLGSLAAMSAPNFPLLLIARLLQAVGTGIFIPTMMNTVLTVAPKAKLGSFLAIGGCTITFGPALAPVVAGLMITFVGWRSIFVIPAIAVVILAVCGFFFVKNVSETERLHLDVLSVLLSALGLTSFVVGLGEVTSQPVIAAIMLALGIGLIALFISRQRRIDNPLMNLQPMRNPRFPIACALVVVAMMTTFSMSVLLPLYFEGAAGTTALVAGTLILMPILMNALTTLFGGRIMDRVGEWPLLPIGFLIIAIGQAAICFVAGSIDIVSVVIWSAVVYAGVGLVFSPSQTAGLRSLEREEYPFGVTIMSTFIQVAACLGPSLFVGILSSRVASQTAAGTSATLAQASGFSAAVAVAAAIALVGCILAFFYARKAKAGKPAAEISTPASLESIMKTDAYSVSETATVFQAMQTMLGHGTTGLPVIVESGQVVGFISDGDIMKIMANQMPVGVDLAYCLISYERIDDDDFDERLAKTMKLNVMELATEHVISVTVETPLVDVCKLLGQRRIKKVPVLNDDKLVGTVSRGDVTRFLMGRSVEIGMKPTA